MKYVLFTFVNLIISPKKYLRVAKNLVPILKGVTWVIFF